VRSIAFLVLAALLSACTTTPAHDVQVVDQAVAVSCVDNPPATPRFHTDSELKAMPDYELALTLLSERIEREIYESKLVALLQACK
jgi:hypothetical protein